MSGQETIGEIVAFYVPYLCGTFDIVAKCQDWGFAVDHKVEIEETVMSIARDAWAAGQKSVRERVQRESVLGSARA